MTTLTALMVQKIEQSPEEDGEKEDKDYKPHGIVGRMAIKPPMEKHARRSKRFENDEAKVKDDSKDDESNKELKRLQFYGAGPKMAGYNVDKKEEKPRGKHIHYDFDPVRV